jgi:hypothetical protein
VKWFSVVFCCFHIANGCIGGLGLNFECYVVNCCVLFVCCSDAQCKQMIIMFIKT